MLTVFKKRLVFFCVFSFVLLLAACEDSSKSKSSVFKTDLDLPDSMTGGKLILPKPGSSKGSFAKPAQDHFEVMADDNDDELFNCAYAGPEDDEIFVNGYNLTQFMVSAVASWTCIGDSLIVISSVLPRDGVVRETEHDGGSSDYDPEEPTHFKITEADEGRVSVYLYYGYSHGAELPEDAVVGFYFTWKKKGEKTVGKMIMDAVSVNSPDHEEDDPVKVRMDLDYDSEVKKVDMFMIFDENNVWANGFRIQVVKDLIANSEEKVYTAVGKMSMDEQFVPVSGISEVPGFDVFTVSNEAGDGAAIAEFSDLALSFPLDGEDHLGNYLGDKEDIYFFDEKGDWDWIYKLFSTALLKGNNRNLSSGDEDIIELLLGLAPDYFTASCSESDDECEALINAIFDDGFEGQEENQGSDPEDWRSSEMENAFYLDSVYPDGFDSWEGVFELN